MRKKMIGIVILMLLITTLLPITTLAGDSENPEVVDRIRDVKLFGVITTPFQMKYQYADIVAAWLDEENANPGYLIVSVQIRNLDEKTVYLEAIYDVDFAWNDDRFITCLHINPEGIQPFGVGRFLDGSNDVDKWIQCEVTVDTETNVITWIVPKEFIGNPPKGSTITSIFPSTHLRFTDASGLPLMDLFKDLSWNARLTKEYIIQY